jgi:hypothetical protein
VVGAFWGAPLVARELGAGTHRLAWNRETVAITTDRLDGIEAIGPGHPVRRRETAMFLAASGLLAGFCFWRIRRVS